MDDLDALLADLQTVVTAGGGSRHPAHYNNYSSHSYQGPQQYNSGGGGGHTVDQGTPYSKRTYEFGSTSPGTQSPVYQNQRSMREVTVTATSYQQQNSPGSAPRSPAPSSNLSELDTLLEDLSVAKYNSYDGRKGTPSPGLQNGPLRKGPQSPTGSSVSVVVDGSRPTVESLLDELQSAVPSSPRSGRPILVNKQAYTSYQPARPPPQTASSATKELDDLMATLSDFKSNPTTLQHRQVPQSANLNDSVYAKPSKQQQQPRAGDRLDSMLGTLQQDMSKQGVNTAQKGCCAACGKPIVGQVVTALAKTWHPEHFTCAHCSQELATKNFFERDGRPYCEPDYHNLFSPRCAYCNGPILDKCVSALDKTWHPEHFFCAQCGEQFGEDGFHEKEGKAYCRRDYFDMFAPKCGGCSRPITENYISALNTQWHAECFVCRDCRVPFNGGSFFDHEGQPYCETHYHAKRGSLCAGCHKPIQGRCVTAMFRKFHPEHFVCSFCMKQLNKGTFKEQNDKPYCHACFHKLFG